MSKLVLAASLIAAVVLAACGSTTPPPSQAVVSPPPVSPAPSVPTDPATPEPADPTAEPPTVTPAPTVRPTPKPTPRPTQPTFSRAERYLIDGIMRGESECSPVRGARLPADAIAGIDCDLVGSPVARAGYYLFKDDADMLDAYFARMQAEGVAVDSGPDCSTSEGEGPYIPYGDDGTPPRQARLLRQPRGLRQLPTDDAGCPCLCGTAQSVCRDGHPRRLGLLREPGHARLPDALGTIARVSAVDPGGPPPDWWRPASCLDLPRCGSTSAEPRQARDAIEGRVKGQRLVDITALHDGDVQRVAGRQPTRGPQHPPSRSTSSRSIG